MDSLTPDNAPSYLRDFDEPQPLKKSAFLTGQYVRRQLKKHQRMDFYFRALTFSSAFSILVLLGAVMITLLKGAMPAIHAFGWRFFTTVHWDPVNNRFGALAPIYGTLMTSFLALLIAVPISF